MVRAFTGCVPSLVCPPARGLPCERFTAVLTDRTSCITRGRGGWLDLPRGGLAPPILCQLSWRALLWVKMSLATHFVGTADLPQTVCPSLKRRLTLDITARVTRIGRAEPQTRRASRGPA